MLRRHILFSPINLSELKRETNNKQAPAKTAYTVSCVGKGSTGQVQSQISGVTTKKTMRQNGSFQIVLSHRVKYPCECAMACAHKGHLGLVATIWRTPAGHRVTGSILELGVQAKCKRRSEISVHVEELLAPEIRPQLSTRLIFYRPSVALGRETMTNYTPRWLSD